MGFIGGVVLSMFAFILSDVVSPFRVSRGWLASLLFTSGVSSVLGIVVFAGLLVIALRVGTSWTGLVIGFIVGTYLVALIELIGIIP